VQPRDLDVSAGGKACDLPLSFRHAVRADAQMRVPMWRHVVSSRVLQQIVDNVRRPKVEPVGWNLGDAVIVAAVALHTAESNRTHENLLGEQASPRKNLNRCTPSARTTAGAALRDDRATQGEVLRQLSHVVHRNSSKARRKRHACRFCSDVVGGNARSFDFSIHPAAARGLCAVCSAKRRRYSCRMRPPRRRGVPRSRSWMTIDRSSSDPKAISSASSSNR